MKLSPKIVVIAACAVLYAGHRRAVRARRPDSVHMEAEDGICVLEAYLSEIASHG